MDLGVVGLEGLVGSETGFVPLASDPETKHKLYGSGFLKQERSGTTTEDEWSRGSKLAKTDDTSKAMLLHNQRNSLLRSNNNSVTLFSDVGGGGGQHQQQQMLSFSTPKSEPLLVDKASQNATLPYSYHPLSSYSRNAGYNSGNMHGALTGARGPFTPSQWMELEHQAFIYKYITANVPVPSHLLTPIRKALDSAAFCNFSTGFLRPNALAWGGFHLGFSSNTDPEPGRCRRTDGKKWRCSRDAVVDQKYCERHMNRGRHRSRKPVEGQSGHAALTTTTSSNSKLLPNSNNANNNNIVVPGGNSESNNTLTFGHCQEHKNMQQPLASDASAANSINRMFMTNNKENNASERIVQDGPALPMLPPTLELKPQENPFMIHNKQIAYEESSRNNHEFGLVTSDSLLNPSNKSTTLLSTRTFGPPTNHNSQDTTTESSQHSLRHFIDEMQSDRTQLSISIPMASSDFMPFTSSPSNEKFTLSPLRLSRELGPIQMGLGVGSALNESSNTKQANWIPITWESSMGGPLGEVLNLSNTNNNDNNNADNDQCANNKNSLNLISDGWDNNSPSIGSSPSGVLQKTAFGSLSNSSAGSSPRAENNKAQEGASLSNDLLGSTPGYATSSSLPAL